MPNRLIDSSSPYLQLHAYNPVEWWEWCPEAWAEAERRHVPVFVSVGYSACHWCHVMAEESFDNPEIAATLNENFVCIKVDREERPDIDAVMMTATQALTGGGGWPTSVFCTPDGAPFFAGTYFPPQPRDGMPGFGQVAAALGAAWRDREAEVLESGRQIVAELAPLQSAPAPTSLDLHAARQRAFDEFDPLHGGWGSQPKFPNPMLIDALLVAGDPGELELATHALEAMARGGIHDQIGGGFHRYAVDAGWVVPHFEKMLSDNALLLGSYTRGWRRTPDHSPAQRALLERVVEGIVGWLERDMRTPEGLFAASLDADSGDIRGIQGEGVYYVWSPELLEDALGADDGGWARSVFHVTEAGTFDEGLSTLILHGHPDAERLASVRERLLAARAEREAPARDDKIIASWNGWLLDSLLQAALVFHRPEWFALARELGEALWSVHWDGTRLARISRDGQATVDGQCVDYAAVALGFARLAGATGEHVWVERAQTLLQRANELFGADDGGWFDASTDADLYARPRDVADSATPSATSTMVAALRLTGLLADDRELLQRAERGLATGQPMIMTSPRAAGWLLEQTMVGDEARRGLRPATVVVVTPDDDPMDELVRAAWRMAPAGSAIVAIRDGERFGSLTEDRHAVGGKATAYVCRGEQCFAPVSGVEELRTPLWTRV